MSARSCIGARTVDRDSRRRARPSCDLSTTAAFEPWLVQVRRLTATAVGRASPSERRTQHAREPGALEEPS